MTFVASIPTDAIGSRNDEPSFAGYSIGQWIDTDGGGRYDLLEVETRGFKGPRTFDSTGIPLHKDNQTIVKERIHLDKADRSILYDEITTIDHALTRPWTVIKKFRHDPSPRPVWTENVCGALTRAGVNGARRSRAPVASNTALASAPATARQVASPILCPWPAPESPA
jgi:hypothetical protein